MCVECYGIYKNCPLCGSDSDEEEDEYTSEDEDIEKYYEDKYGQY